MINYLHIPCCKNKNHGKSIFLFSIYLQSTMNLDLPTPSTCQMISALYTCSNPPHTSLSSLLSSNSLNLPFNQAIDPVLLDIPHYPADYCMEIFLLHPSFLDVSVTGCI